MLAKVIIENGVKKIQALTADTGTGAPVGSYLYLEKKSNPQGYLYCDGSTFDETAYPALYQYLGTNVLPDWREFSAVGAEQNTTSSVIATHDVYTEGQAKDDQLQKIAFTPTTDAINVWTDGNPEQDNSPFTIINSNYSPNSGSYGSFMRLGFDSSKCTRSGTVTRGKRKAVFIYIKATSGLTENQQENVLNTINENNSYSTEEHATGKKWIDGKDIYSRVISEEVSTYSDSGTGNRRAFNVVVTDANIDTIVGYYGNWVSLQGEMVGRQILLGMTLPNDNMGIYWTSDLCKTGNNVEITAIVDRSSYPVTKTKINAVIEYTKTTD